jgi:hypothetical protein
MTIQKCTFYIKIGMLENNRLEFHVSFGNQKLIIYIYIYIYIYIFFFYK